MLLVIFIGLTRLLQAVPVTFQVDMSQMVVSPLGVHLAGDFQGWDPSSYPMNDIGGGIFSLTIDLPPGTYEFKFINGNAWGSDELVPIACGVDNGGNINRQIVVSSDAVLPAICYAQCDPCSPASYVMNGSAASLGGDCYQITPSMQWQNGAIWSNTQVDLNYDFDLQFNVYLGTEDALGADGIVFVLQRLGSSAIGVNGGGIGYSSFGTSLGIEFDTYYNPEYNDPVYDHLSIEMDGDVYHYGPNNLSWPVQMSASSTNTEDGAYHLVTINWNAATQTISVYFDCVFRLQANYDLVNGIFGGENLVFWGFTGATGALYNQQMVCAVPNALETAQVTICPGSSVQLSAGASIDGLYTWTPATYLDDPSIANPIANPPDSLTYEVSYRDLCNVLRIKQITVDVVNNGPACFLLPADLIYFDVKPINDQVEFSWQSSSEDETAYYLVESSVDGIRYVPHFSVAATGHSFGYSEIRKREREGRYYRLSEVDIEGRRSLLSGAHYVSGILRDDFHSWYDAEQMTCLVRMPEDGTYLIECCDAAGRVVVQQKSQSGTMSIPMQEARGIYFLRILDEQGGLLYTNRILKI